MTGESFEYAYDQVGNRTTMTTTLGATTVTTYTYDAANHLTKVGDVAYTWDARGNLTNDGVFTYTYNAAGRMVRAQSLTSTLLYTYTADGLRVAQSVQSVTESVDSFSWEWASAVPELLSTGGARYLVGHETLGQWDGVGWSYYLPDALGSVRQTADDTGTVLDAREWTPFGVEVGAAQAGLGYTGEWWDGHSSLLYLRARWLDVATGRFTQRDPWEGDITEPQTLFQGYVYVVNNPINLIDPTGQYEQDVHFDITLEAASKYPLDFFAAMFLALGAAHLDDAPLYAFPGIGHPEFHFAGGSTLDRNWRAVLSDPVDPYLYGCVIHQYQDWFSHWYEGYTNPELGHGADSAMAWTRFERGATSDFFFGYHYNSQGGRVESPLPAHPAEEVRNQLRSRYPGEDFNQFTSDELIDLYLREFAGPGSPERGYFGYNTDAFFEFTMRDKLMVSMTDFLVREFYIFSLSSCGWESSYDHATDEEIIQVLTTGQR